MFIPVPWEVSTCMYLNTCQLYSVVMATVPKNASVKLLKKLSST
jgi:hypothetical protein